MIALNPMHEHWPIASLLILAVIAWLVAAVVMIRGHRLAERERRDLRALDRKIHPAPADRRGAPTTKGTS